MGDTAEEISRDISAVARIDAVPTLLRVLCDSTGMGFAAVARVTDNTWTACAVLDDIEFGLKPGGQLDLASTLCTEVRASRTPVVIDHASRDPIYCSHHTPRIYSIESYVSVPIVLTSGEYFGNLCAIHPHPAQVSEPRIVSMFTLFAQLIALQLESDRKSEIAHAAWLDERAVGELREQFIAVLGHDLRNPLAAVAAAGHILQLRHDDPDLTTLATSIKRSVKRMSGLINDVLDFARGRLGSGIGVHVEAVADIEEALLAVVNELKDANPERRIQCAIDKDLIVNCDRARIQQLASNLLANGLTHGSPQGVIKLAANRDGEDFVLSVWNDGEPIAPDSIAKIFEPFWRPSAQREGLGLGLHICAQIVTAHRGTIDVASTPEAGTTFTARLPLNFDSRPIPPI